MNTGRIEINGKLVEFNLGIKDEEIERILNSKTDMTIDDVMGIK